MEACIDRQRATMLSLTPVRRSKWRDSGRPRIDVVVTMSWLDVKVAKRRSKRQCRVALAGLAH